MTRPLTREMDDKHRAFIDDIRRLTKEHEDALFEHIEDYVCGLLEDLHMSLKDINDRLDLKDITKRLEVIERRIQKQQRAEKRLERVKGDDTPDIDGGA